MKKNISQKWMFTLLIFLTVGLQACGDSDEEKAAVQAATTIPTTSSTDTSTDEDEDQYLNIQADSDTLSRTQSTYITVSGGQSPYVVTVSSGGGTFNSSTSTFTAPNYDGTTILKAVDNLGSIVYLTLTTSATSLYATTLASEIDKNEYIKISASGGVAPYTYSLVSGSGSVSGSYYLSPNFATVAKIKVQDAEGEIFTFSLTVIDQELIDLCADFSGTIVKISGKTVCSLPVADDATVAEQVSCPSEWATFKSGGVPYTITKKVLVESKTNFWGGKVTLETDKHSSFQAKANRECVTACTQVGLFDKCLKTKQVCSQVTNIACTLE